MARPAWRDQRTPVDVVEQSGQQSTALAQIIALDLEAAGFVVSTSDWPVISVRVGDRQHTVTVGAGGPQVARLRVALTELQRLVDQL